MQVAACHLYTTVSAHPPVLAVVCHLSELINLIKNLSAVTSSM